MTSIASQLSEEKNKARNNEADEAEAAEAEDMSWMERLNIRRRVREKARAMVKEKVELPAKMASARAWQWAWYVLIPSWGLSLIVLDILWFGSLVTGLICKPGEEWIPKKAQAVAGDAGELAGKAIGIVERMGLGLLNAIAFFIVMAVLAILYFMADSLIVKAVYYGTEVFEWSKDILQWGGQ